MPISQGLAHGMVPVGGYHLLGQPPVPAPAPAGGSDNPGVAGINPVVQKLMSNPGVHSVDAIEAEQRMSASPPTIEQVKNQWIIFIKRDIDIYTRMGDLYLS